LDELRMAELTVPQNLDPILWDDYQAHWSCPGSVDSLALRIASCLGGQRQGCAFVV
jgi:hypothetical protein